MVVFCRLRRCSGCRTGWACPKRTRGGSSAGSTAHDLDRIYRIDHLNNVNTIDNIDHVDHVDHIEIM